MLALHLASSYPDQNFRLIVAMRRDGMLYVSLIYNGEAALFLSHSDVSDFQSRMHVFGYLKAATKDFIENKDVIYD